MEAMLPAPAVDQAAPLPDRSNGWRYLGPREGEIYRRQAVFGAGLLVHPCDADTWRATFVNVEGGGHGQLVVSAADETWRVILCWGSRGRRIDVNQHGIPASPVDLQVCTGVTSEDPCFRQLNSASFGHRLVKYDPLTEFGSTWKESLPGTCLAVLVADSWQDCQVDLRARDRRRFGFRDVDPLTGTFGRCANMTEAILSSSQTETDQKTARKRRRGADDTADSKKTWYATPANAVDELMLHLHLGGVACTGRLTSYSNWDSLSLPAHGTIIRTWCGASMDGLDPNVLECDEATRLIELHGTLGRKLIRGVMDFCLSSEYSPSLLALLEVCWRGPIVGAKDASGTAYGPGDCQCDINGEHTAAMLSMENLPAFTHMYESARKNAASRNRVFAGIEVKLALDDLPPAMRTIPCPLERVLRVVPLWGGIGETFGTMGAAHAAWRSVGKDDNRKMWSGICAAESPATLERLIRELMSREDRVVCAVTGEHGGAGKSYCTLRAAKAVFKTGLVLTPTNNLRTSYTDRPSGKTAGSIHIPRVDVVIIEEAAYMSLHVLSMILAAAHSNGVHVIGTYDTHQLQPVRENSDMSISVDNVDRLLYILDAGDNSAEAQTRALERFGGVHPTRNEPHVSDFHLDYTRDCARFHAFRGLTRWNETGGWDALGKTRVVGAQYRNLGKTGKVHKIHAHHIVRSSDDSVVVQKILFDPPGSCTVHAVQGRTVDGKLVIHQARQRFLDLFWLSTAISRATGPSNVVVLDDVHRSNMPEQARRSWATRKVSSYLRADVTAGRLYEGEGGQHKNALVQALVTSNGERCNSYSIELVWAVSLNKNVWKVRLQWMETYGASHNGGPVRNELQSLQRLIKREASKAKKTKGQRLKQLKTAEERVLMSATLDLPAKCLDLVEWVSVACGQSSLALQRKSATVTTDGVADQLYRPWVFESV
ncbi:unnamed protein product [Ectocarpus sp. CCAP 1310/34]|nr:unnamed protein product [Ectocarpus sp. CCAP 1310/34]